MPLGGARLRQEGRSNVSGLRVRERRLALKLKQDMLCGRIATVTDGEWNPDRLEVLRIEQGTRTVTDLELLVLAKALDCTFAWLLTGEGATTPFSS
jgi:transcriptional regulator with XRE-family HTH domain